MKATGPNPLSSITALSAGGQYTCAATGGAAKCWGSNLTGQMGDGFSGSTAQDWLATQSAGLTSGVTKIDAGLYLTCAIVANAAKCWGGGGGIGNYLGSDTSTTSSLTQVQVKDLIDHVTDISVGEHFACAIRSEALSCWGANPDGLGQGSTDSLIPVLVAPSGASQVAVGGNFACYLTTTGGVKCWGGNAAGQLGTGDTVTYSTPTDVAALTSGVAKIAVGGNYAQGGQSCAVTTTGSLLCWGLNQYGAVGDGTLNNALAPALVPSLTTGVTDVATGYRHTCAVVSEGAQCWGLNDSGQLGDGFLGTQVSPVAVSGLTSGVASVAAGGNGEFLADQTGSHSCALLKDGTARCWGFANSGQLGIGMEVSGDGSKRYLTSQLVLTP